MLHGLQMIAILQVLSYWIYIEWFVLKRINYIPAGVFNSTDHNNKLFAFLNNPSWKKVGLLLGVKMLSEQIYNIKKIYFIWNCKYIHDK